MSGGQSTGVRHGWPRSAPHSGYVSGRHDAGNDREDDRRREVAADAELDEFAVGDRLERPHRPVPARGVDEIRICDPARNTWANGKISTRASAKPVSSTPSGNGSASASRWVWTGRCSVEASSSSARWLARSQPDWTYISCPSGRISRQCHLEVGVAHVGADVQVCRRRTDHHDRVGQRRRGERGDRPGGRLLPIPHHVGAPQVRRDCRS